MDLSAFRTHFYENPLLLNGAFGERHASPNGMVRVFPLLFVGLAPVLGAQVGPALRSCSPAPAQAREPGIVRDHGAFALRVARGDTALRIRGFDSQVGGWAGNGHEIAYDYGSYSDQLDSLPYLIDVHRCHASIGGHSTLIVLAKDSVHRFVVAAHWPRLRSSSLGAISLTLFGTATDSSGQLDLLRTIWSVRFKP